MHGADRLHELRLRAGRGVWRALYRRVGEIFVIAAIEPEAQGRQARLWTSVAAAQARLDLIEEDQT